MTDILARIGFHTGRAALEAVYYISMPLVYPYLLLRHYTAAIRPGYANLQKGIWVHAASLGEVNAVKPILLELRRRLPTTQILLTTTSETGMKAAAKIGNGISAALSVLDVPHLRRKQFHQLDPGLICIVETEIWPNMLYEAAKKKIPVLFLNARMSESTLSRLRKTSTMLKYVSASVGEIFASAESDAQRFKQLFSAPVTLAGNIKGAVSLAAYDKESIRKQWNFDATDFIVCAGSTRPGEEKMILEMLPRLQREIPNIKIIVAIRHPQRSQEVRGIFRKTGFRAFGDPQPAKGSAGVFILDVLGQLDKAYAMCDLALVGGSFVDFGGHNPLEPVFYHKPVIMGPHHSSCENTVKALLEADAIRVVDAEDLADQIISLWRDPNMASQLGQNGQKVLERFNGSLAIHVSGILKWTRQ